MSKEIEIDGLTSAETNDQSVLPVGYVYWQFPGKDSPADMSLPGTWEIISGSGKDFDGIFPSIEGTDRAAFDGTVQADQMQLIEGSLNGNMFTGSSFTADGAFSESVTISVGGVAGGTAGDKVNPILFDSSKSLNARTGDKTYPENVAIRLWERIS